MKNYTHEVIITATHYNHRTRSLRVGYNVVTDEHQDAIRALYYRMKKPYLWYGCGYEIHYKNNVLEGVFEPGFIEEED